MTTADLIERFLRGDRRALARAITRIENGEPDAPELLRAIYPRTGRAHVVGVTGAPGVGKSTLVDRMAAELRRRGRRVGIVAVDPSSPFTGGAVLGDRIRMGVTSDPDVFMRSLAARGHLGGVSAATEDVLAALEAFGFDTLLLETVGAGQSEVEVMELAQTVAVVVAPGLGDDVQAIKAGILEIGSLFVVNKADREGADRTVMELEAMLALGHKGGPRATEAERAHHGRGPAAGGPPSGDDGGRDGFEAAGVAGDHGEPAGATAWSPPVLKTVARDGQGVPDAVDAVVAHGEHLRLSGRWTAMQRGRARARLERLVVEQVRRSIFNPAAPAPGLAQAEAAVAARQEDPYTAAERLLAWYRERG